MSTGRDKERSRDGGSGWSFLPDGRPEPYPMWEEMERLEFFMVYSTRLEDEIADLLQIARRVRTEGEEERAAMRQLRSELTDVCERSRALSHSIRGEEWITSPGRSGSIPQKGSSPDNSQAS